MLEHAIKAAVSAGEILISHYGKIEMFKQKESLRDVVTEVDQLSEKKIISILRNASNNYGMLTEESGFIGNNKDEYWVIDALDGTVNYIHKIPLFSVSIALFKSNKPILGVIYNPLSEDLYYASEETGSFKNQKRLKIKNTSLKQSVLSMAFSGKTYNKETRNKGFQLFGEINDNSQGCLRTGSAAMNLAYVAEGKFGAAIGKANKLWDIAAGLIIATTAGGSGSYNIVDKEKYLTDYIIGSSSCWNELNKNLNLNYLNL
tara:strand:+ start:239 stop:1018 length:780 start_codon:yes stop_codon:yes gene_type:complete